MADPAITTTSRCFAWRRRSPSTIRRSDRLACRKKPPITRDNSATFPAGDSPWNPKKNIGTKNSKRSDRKSGAIPTADANGKRSGSTITTASATVASAAAWGIPAVRSPAAAPTGNMKLPESLHSETEDATSPECPLFGLEFRVISSGSSQRWVAAAAAAATAATVAMAAAMAATAEERARREDAKTPFQCARFGRESENAMAITR